MDSKETGFKGQHGKNPHHKAAKAEISRIWLLQGQQSKGMEMQTPSGICKEVQENPEGNLHQGIALRGGTDYFDPQPPLR